LNPAVCIKRYRIKVQYSGYRVLDTGFRNTDYSVQDPRTGIKKKQDTPLSDTRILLICIPVSCA
jgi:hypothetical protein